MIFLLKQFSSFVVVGFIATGMHFTVLIVLVQFAGIAAVPAALAGYAAGGLVSYSLNRKHVFRSNAPHHAAGTRFALVVAAGFGLTYLFMSLFVNYAKIPYLIAQVGTTGIVLFWNFAAHKMWTFSRCRDAR